MTAFIVCLIAGLLIAAIVFVNLSTKKRPINGEVMWHLAKHGYTQREIARYYGCAQSTVNKHLKRAQEKYGKLYD